MTKTKPKQPTMHYAGELRTKRMHIMPGFAACCYGDKAWNIRNNRQNTFDKTKVTCSACLKRMRSAGEV